MWDRSSMSAGEHDRTDELARAQARLRDVDHRVKNDLQLIASVFVLQMRRLPEGGDRDLIRGALDRMGAVSAVWRRLDVSADPRYFEASALVGEAAQEAVGAARREDIGLNLHLSSATIPTRQAAPLALVVGELVRNSLKHAFPGRSGVISVCLEAEGKNVILTVSDDGVGLPPGQTAPAGFGATLIALLTQQLRGELEFADAGPGLRALLKFPSET